MTQDAGESRAHPPCDADDCPCWLSGVESTRLELAERHVTVVEAMRGLVEMLAGVETEVEPVRESEPDPAPRTHPWFARPPDHMKGWEAFGVSPGERTVRRLGVVTFRKGEAVTDERPGTDPWGPGEVKLGVAGICIAASADNPEGAFIQVIGTTEADVAARWDVAHDAWLDLAAILWPKSRSTPDSGSSRADR